MRTAILLLGIGLLGLLVACGEPDALPHESIGADPSPTYDPHELNVTPAPVTPPATVPAPRIRIPDPNDPFLLRSTGELGPSDNSPEQVVRFSDLIVTGRVVEILPARWTTPEGQRPANPWESSVTHGDMIITPVVIELDAPPLLNLVIADPKDGRVVAAAFGGRVGADEFETNSPVHQFRGGERVLVGLSNWPLMANGTAPYPTPAGLAWSVEIKYVLTDDGQAVSANPHDKPLDASAFLARIREAAKFRSAGATPTAHP